MKVKPLGERLVLEKISKEEKTLSGIIIPNAANDSSNLAVVVAISDSLDDSEIKLGDKVIFSEYKATQIESDDNKDLLVIDYDDVLAIIE